MDEQGANNWLLVLTNIGTTHKTHTFTADFPRLSETRIPFWFMFQTFSGSQSFTTNPAKTPGFFFFLLFLPFFSFCSMFYVLEKEKKRLEKMSILFTWDFLFDKDKCCGEQRGTYPFFFSLSLLIPLCGLVSKYLPIYLLVKWEKNRPSKKMKFSVSPSPIIPFLLGPFPLSRYRYTNTLRMYPVFIYI